LSAALRLIFRMEIERGLKSQTALVMNKTSQRLNSLRTARSKSEELTMGM
jgi:hypothetical protein